MEDNEDILDILHRKLINRYNIYIARDAVAALERINTISNLDLIISDILMPGMDGWELLKKIMQSERYKEIPFIFLTAVTDDKCELKGFSLGAEEYIKKSTPIDIILTRIDNSIRHSKKIKSEQFTALRAIIKEFHTREKNMSENSYENTLNEILTNINSFCIRH